MWHINITAGLLVQFKSVIPEGKVEENSRQWSGQVGVHMHCLVIWPLLIVSIVWKTNLEKNVFYLSSLTSWDLQCCYSLQAWPCSHLSKLCRNATSNDYILQYCWAEKWLRGLPLWHKTSERFTLWAGFTLRGGLSGSILTWPRLSTVLIL